MKRLLFSVFTVLLLTVGTAQAGLFEDGLAAYKRGDYSDTVKLYRLSAAHGDLSAQDQLGDMYHFGKGVAQDHTALPTAMLFIASSAYAVTPKSNSPISSDDAMRAISDSNSIHIVDTQSTEIYADHAIHALPVNMKRGDAWHENASELQQGIRNFTILVYEMTVERVPSISDAHNRLLNRSRESLSKAQVDVIEERNIWWVQANRIFIRLYNPTSKDISGVIFSLAKSCGSVDEGVKLFLSFDLGASSLKATQYAMYSSNLPFNFANSLGSGTLCGIVEMASG